MMEERISGKEAERHRVRVKISGIVQGVGMRPFLHRLARRLQITGWARNTLEGVEMVLEGDRESLSAFVREIRENPPPLAVVEAADVMEQEDEQGDAGMPGTEVPEALTVTERRVRGFETFEILESSSKSPGHTLIAPDMAPCSDCLKELFTPSDRRFRYPFINCTNCGPRFTIIKALPYDRTRTSMKKFPMCPVCREEYGDIENRRYHAQPDCCPVCGPVVYFLDSAGNRALGDPFRLAQEMLFKGGILAVKGIGGIHLACDAENSEAVERLRRLKHREAKPLAVMCASRAEAERFCRISEAERRLLESPRRPIVLCEKKRPGSLLGLSENSRLGLMLPYTPLHMLLLDGTFGGPRTLVMTSANEPDCPVFTEDAEALCLLKGKIDGFLFHNRPIENRCDDSLVMEWQGREYSFRRSRGYAPQPVMMGQDCTGILALGAQQKASFALGQGNKAFLSQHIGDLDSLETQDFFRENISRFAKLFHIQPGFLVCDLHPEYESARIGEEMAAQMAVPLLKIQHHWAHMAACMADNRLEGDAFGIIWDGTGMGTDGTIWGAEFLAGNYKGFERRGSIRPILLPGGEEAIRRIGRIGFSLLWDLGRGTPFMEENAKAVPLAGDRQERQALTAILEKRISCVEASSMGRLFDGVDALLEGRARARYEGEGAALLEALGTAASTSVCPYPRVFYEEDGVRRFDTRPMVKQIILDKQTRVPSADIARRFMETLAVMALEQCLYLNTEKNPVILSGGVFQNHFLLDRIGTLLKEAGFAVFCHRRVAPNDQGLSLGQIAIAQRSEEYRVLSSAVKDNKN